MASIRCEALEFNQTVVSEFGTANTTTSPTTPSAVIYGPVARQTDVVVRSKGWQGYIAKGTGTPVAAVANGSLLSDAEFVSVRLAPGESIAAIAATVS